MRRRRGNGNEPPEIEIPRMIVVELTSIEAIRPPGPGAALDVYDEFKREIEKLEALHLGPIQHWSFMLGVFTGAAPRVAGRSFLDAFGLEHAELLRRDLQALRERMQDEGR